MLVVSAPRARAWCPLGIALVLGRVVKKGRTVFIGREQETEELLVGLDQVWLGRGRLFLIDGEPGVGKTRLAEELAYRARERSALVLWSRCWEASGAPAYWPWIQIIRSLLRGAVGKDFFSQNQSAIADIAQIIPEACEIAGIRRASARDCDPEEARFRFFDAVSTLLRTAANIRPLVLVLDELGAADRPSLLLLTFLARELHDCRIMIAATYRAAEVRSSPALAEALSGLGHDAETITLRGFSRDEVELLIESQTLVKPSPDAVDAIFQASGGNPFFATSIVKLETPESLARAGHDSIAPRLDGSNRFGAAIEGHLAPLSPDARRVLTLAAIIGREFDAAVLSKIAETQPATLANILGEFTIAGLAAEAQENPGHYRFVHPLIRDALYEGIPPVERAQLHNQAGEIIEELYGGDSDSHLTDLAYHFSEGARAGPPARAIEYAQRAAERALELAAFEESARCYQMALSAMKLAGRFDKRRRCELLLALGEAQSRSADYAGARDSLRQAAELAHKLGDLELLARSALGYPGMQWGTPSGANEEAIRALEHALEAFPRDDDAWRAMLMARLASELYYRPAALERRTALAEQAVKMARRTGDKRALLAVLGHRDLNLSGPDSLHERFKNSEEMSRVAEETGSYIGLYLGLLSRTIYFRHIGEISKAAAEAESMALIARSTRLPVCAWGVQCFAAGKALLEGRFEEFERVASDCVKFAERLRGRDASDLFWPVAIAPMWEQGRLAELEPMAVETVKQHRDLPVYRALLALIHLRLGDTRRAQTEFELLATQGFTDLARDNTFLPCASALAELCAGLGDGRRAAQLLALLEPYSDLNAIFGPLGGYGAVARYLGTLATAASRYADAEEFFEKALVINRRNSALAHIAYTQADYGAMLLKRGLQRHRAKALDLLSSAARMAEGIGMNALSETIESLGEAQSTAQAPRADELALPLFDSDGQLAGAHLPVIAGSQVRLGVALGQAANENHEDRIILSDRVGPASISRGGNGKSRAPGDALFRRDGDYWTISYAGQVVRLRHVKGLSCLAYLLGHPEAEVHASSLASAAANDSPIAAGGPEVVVVDGGGGWMSDAGPVLDTQAKSEYKRRILELREELEEARQMNDLGRVAQAEEALNFITAELSRALGLHGRDRRLSSPSERARLNVTKAIKGVLGKIADHHRVLGKHLVATVKTGTFCSYKPDPSSPISWRFN